MKDKIIEKLKQYKKQVNILIRYILRMYYTEGYIDKRVEKIKQLESELQALQEREELNKGWKELENSGLDKPFNPNESKERKEIMEKYGITEDMVDDYMKQFPTKEPQGAEDLKQYMTNLLYAAYAFNDKNKLVDNTEFDKWVEEQTELLEQYHNERLPSDMEIATEIVARFLHNPHPNQRDKYNREKKAFADGVEYCINYFNNKL